MSYFGGKDANGVCERLINHTPPHSVRLITHAGHDALTRRIHPCERVILCDLDPDVCQWWEDKQLPFVEIHNSCGLAMMRTIAAEFGGSRGNELFTYIDPPYPMETRISRHRYPFEMTDEQHTELLRLAIQMPGCVMLSTYPNLKYADALINWQLIEYMAPTQGGLRPEWLLMNYCPLSLHDYRLVGADGEERWKLTKRDRNLINRLRRLPAFERNRQIAAIVAEFGDDRGMITRELNRRKRL